MNDSRRSDWTSVIAVALIGLGVWFLLGNVLGPAWREIVRQFFRFAAPLALIAFGVLLYLASQRGGEVTVRGRQLRRSRSNRMLAGVLGGLAQTLGIDAVWLRVGFVLFGLMTFMTWFLALAFYIIAMVVIPEERAGSVAAPSWPQAGTGGQSGGPGGTAAGTGAPSGPTPPPRSSGWPHTGGTETVQQPAPPEPPGEHGPAQS